MITHMPELYPGELLYSWIARYHFQSGNLSFKRTTFDLFGKESYISTPDLPCSLDSFYKNIQHFYPLNPKELIKKHTFYNYYTAFSSKEIKERVLNSMLYKHSYSALHMLTGNMASSVKDIQFFRYCSTCVYEDIFLYGEPYLHTVHQFPSSFICTLHDEALCNTTIPFRGINKNEFRVLQLSNCPGIEIISNIDGNMKSKLLNVALESKKLIENNICFEPELHRMQYKLLLSNKGLLTPKGNVRQRELSELFFHFYDDELLKLLQSPINLNSDICWLKSITRKTRKAFHSVRHILYIIFLGETLDSLNSNNEIINNAAIQFGKGPFPCLNKAATHYKKDIINEVRVTSCTKTKLPIGTFNCNCGFIYARRGPDPQMLNKYSIGRIKQFGDVWFEKLHQLVGTGLYSFREIGRKLNVDTKTVIKYSKKTPNPSLKVSKKRISTNITDHYG